jgi:hypothetical protein
MKDVTMVGFLLMVLSSPPLLLITMRNGMLIRMPFCQSARCNTAASPYLVED